MWSSCSVLMQTPVHIFKLTNSWNSFPSHLNTMLILITYIEAFVHEMYSYFNNSVSEKYWGIMMTWLKWQFFYGTWNIQALRVGFASKSETRFIRHKITSLFWDCSLASLKNLRFSWKTSHRIAEAVSDFWRSPTPTPPAQSRVSLSRLLQDMPRWVLNVSKDGDSSTSLGNQLQIH